MNIIVRENLDCNLYIDTDAEINILLINIADLFSSKLKRNSLVTDEGYITITENQQFNPINKKSPLDGFLFYRYILDVKPNPNLEKDNAISFVSKILEEFWANGFPAIANCEYESDLPNNGGYKSENVPIPD